MCKIKVLVDAGIAFPDAVKASLGMSIREFAEKYGVVDTAVSGLINGSTPYPYERVRDALAAELGVERAWLDERIPARAAA